MKKIPTILLLSFLASAAASQAATIYLEDFTGQSGQGEGGTGSVDWTVDLNGGDPTDFSVTTATTGNGTDIGEHFRATNTNAGDDQTINGVSAVWISPLIDTTAFIGQTLTVSVDVTAAGALGFYEAEDLVEIFYIVDGVSTSLGDLITSNDNFNGQTGGNTVYGVTQQITANFLAGSNVQVQVEFDLNTNNNESVAIDNISVIPEPSTFTLLGLGMAGFFIRRRK